MRKFYFIIPAVLILLFLIVSFVNNKQKTCIKIRGSETIYPLCQAFIKDFSKGNRRIDFDLKSEGSEIGISALKREETDIALSSRPLNIGEKVYFQEANIAYEEKIVAYDALALIINRHNHTSRLNKEQITRIFSGRITNWKEVGGEDHEIYVYTRDPNSGTYHFFNSVFLETGTPLKSAVPVTENTEIINKVKENKYAISYIGLGYLNEEVKGVSISMFEDNYVMPNDENVQSLKYPVIRPLYFYYLKNEAEEINTFMDYILSPIGQEIVYINNYIPIRNYQKQVRHIIPTPF